MTGNEIAEPLSWGDSKTIVKQNSENSLIINNSLLNLYGGVPEELPYGRKPYLISKEYVLPGEDYDYLKMMETKFVLGENNSWVVANKPYKHKDYLLSKYTVSGYSQKYQNTTVRLIPKTNNAIGLSITSVVNGGSTTTVTIVASSNAAGSYYIYAEDSYGNKITRTVSISSQVSRPFFRNNSVPFMYYELSDLTAGVESGYTVFTIAPSELLTPEYNILETDLVQSFFFNSDGHGWDAGYTYYWADSTVAFSTFFTVSYASNTTPYTNIKISGTQGDVGYPPNKYNYVYTTSSPQNLYLQVNGPYVNYYKFSQVPMIVALDSPHTYNDTNMDASGSYYNPGKQWYSGIRTDFYYENPDLVIYRRLYFSNYPGSPVSYDSYSTTYDYAFSGFYSLASFDFSISFQHGGVYFGYV
jgi:hypothetical protein